MANYIPDLSGFGRGGGNRAESSVGQALQALMGMLAAKKSEERQLTRQTQLGGEQHSRELELEEARARREEAKDIRREKYLIASNAIELQAEREKMYVEMIAQYESTLMAAATHEYDALAAMRTEELKEGEAKTIVPNLGDLLADIRVSPAGIAGYQRLNDTGLGWKLDPKAFGVSVPETPAPLPGPPPDDESLPRVVSDISQPRTTGEALGRVFGGETGQGIEKWAT